jgi:UDP-N-acetylmuramate--alanine ligase
LFTRTRDFYKDFADALSLLDEVWLTEIYPARELPIEGVTSQLIFDNLRADMKKALCMKQDLPAIVAEEDLDVLVVLGAGDVEDYMEQFRKILEEK